MISCMEAIQQQLMECTLDNTPLPGPPCGPDAPKLPAVALSVYDGDTLKLAVHYKGGFWQVTCRLLGLDSPEIKQPSVRAKALRAKLLLAKEVRPDVPGLSCDIGCKSTRLDLFNSDAVLHVQFPCCHTDKYGRNLAVLYGPNGESINNKLLTAYPDLFRPYDGGARQHVSAEV